MGLTRPSRHSVKTALARRPGLPRWRILLALIVLVGGGYLLIGGDAGLLELAHRRQELRRLEEQVASLEARNDSLRQVLWLLENDLDYVEKVAREEYGMIRPGEQLYRIRTQPKAAQGPQ